MIAETRHDNVTVTNSGYQVGDTVAVTQPGRSPGKYTTWSATCKPGAETAPLAGGVAR
jgi:hypothetical protein